MPDVPLHTMTGLFIPAQVLSAPGGAAPDGQLASCSAWPMAIPVPRPRSTRLLQQAAAHLPFMPKHIWRGVLGWSTKRPADGSPVDEAPVVLRMPLSAVWAGNANEHGVFAWKQCLNGARLPRFILGQAEGWRADSRLPHWLSKKLTSGKGSVTWRDRIQLLDARWRAEFPRALQTPFSGCDVEAGAVLSINPRTLWHAYSAAIAHLPGASTADMLIITLGGPRGSSKDPALELCEASDGSRSWHARATALGLELSVLDELLLIQDIPLGAVLASSGLRSLDAYLSGWNAWDEAACALLGTARPHSIGALPAVASAPKYHLRHVPVEALRQAFVHKSFSDAHINSTRQAIVAKRAPTLSAPSAAARAWCTYLQQAFAALRPPAAHFGELEQSGWGGRPAPAPRSDMSADLRACITAHWSAPGIMDRLEQIGAGIPAHIASADTSTLSPSNDRLEKLGDAVLYVAVTWLLWQRWRGTSASTLAVRIAVVCENGALALAANSSGLSKLLRLSGVALFRDTSETAGVAASEVQRMAAVPPSWQAGHLLGMADRAPAPSQEGPEEAAPVPENGSSVALQDLHKYLADALEAWAAVLAAWVPWSCTYQAVRGMLGPLLEVVPHRADMLCQALSGDRSAHLEPSVEDSMYPPEELATGQPERFTTIPSLSAARTLGRSEQHTWLVQQVLYGLPALGHAPMLAKAGAGSGPWHPGATWGTHACGLPAPLPPAQLAAGMDSHRRAEVQTVEMLAGTLQSWREWLYGASAKEAAAGEPCAVAPADPGTGVGDVLCTLVLAQAPAWAGGCCSASTTHDAALAWAVHHGVSDGQALHAPNAASAARHGDIPIWRDSDTAALVALGNRVMLMAVNCALWLAYPHATSGLLHQATHYGAMHRSVQRHVADQLEQAGLLTLLPLDVQASVQGTQRLHALFGTLFVAHQRQAAAQEGDSAQLGSAVWQWTAVSSPLAKQGIRWLCGQFAETIVYRMIIPAMTATCVQQVLAAHHTLHVLASQSASEVEPALQQHSAHAMQPVSTPAVRLATLAHDLCSQASQVPKDQVWATIRAHGEQLLKHEPWGTADAITAACATAMVVATGGLESYLLAADLAHARTGWAGAELHGLRAKYLQQLVYGEQAEPAPEATSAPLEAQLDAQDAAWDAAYGALPGKAKRSAAEAAVAAAALPPQPAAADTAARAAAVPSTSTHGLDAAISECQRIGQGNPVLIMPWIAVGLAAEPHAKPELLAGVRRAVALATPADWGALSLEPKPAALRAQRDACWGLRPLGMVLTPARKAALAWMLQLAHDQPARMLTTDWLQVDAEALYTAGSRGLACLPTELALVPMRAAQGVRLHGLEIGTRDAAASWNLDIPSLPSACAAVEEPGAQVMPALHALLPARLQWCLPAIPTLTTVLGEQATSQLPAASIEAEHVALHDTIRRTVSSARKVHGIPYKFKALANWSEQRVSIHNITAQWCNTSREWCKALGEYQAKYELPEWQGKAMVPLFAKGADNGLDIRCIGSLLYMTGEQGPQVVDLECAALVVALAVAWRRLTAAPGMPAPHAALASAVLAALEAGQATPCGFLELPTAQAVWAGLHADLARMPVRAYACGIGTHVPAAIKPEEDMRAQRKPHCALHDAAWSAALVQRAALWCAGPHVWQELQLESLPAADMSGLDTALGPAVASNRSDSGGGSVASDEDDASSPAADQGCHDSAADSDGCTSFAQQCQPGLRLPLADEDQLLQRWNEPRWRLPAADEWADFWAGMGSADSFRWHSLSLCSATAPPRRAVPAWAHDMAASVCHHLRPLWELGDAPGFLDNEDFAKLMPPAEHAQHVEYAVDAVGSDGEELPFPPEVLLPEPVVWVQPVPGTDAVIRLEEGRWRCRHAAPLASVDEEYCKAEWVAMFQRLRVCVAEREVVNMQLPAPVHGCHLVNYTNAHGDIPVLRLLKARPCWWTPVPTRHPARLPPISLTLDDAVIQAGKHAIGYGVFGTTWCPASQVLRSAGGPACAWDAVHASAEGCTLSWPVASIAPQPVAPVPRKHITNQADAEQAAIHAQVAAACQCQPLDLDAEASFKASASHTIVNAHTGARVRCALDIRQPSPELRRALLAALCARTGNQQPPALDSAYWAKMCAASEGEDYAAAPGWVSPRNETLASPLAWGVPSAAAHLATVRHGPWVCQVRPWLFHYASTYAVNGVPDLACMDAQPRDDAACLRAASRVATLAALFWLGPCSQPNYLASALVTIVRCAQRANDAEEPELSAANRRGTALAVHQAVLGLQAWASKLQEAVRGALLAVRASDVERAVQCCTDLQACMSQLRTPWDPQSPLVASASSAVSTLQRMYIVRGPAALAMSRCDVWDPLARQGFALRMLGGYRTSASVLQQAASAWARRIACSTPWYARDHDTQLLEEADTLEGSIPGLPSELFEEGGVGDSGQHAEPSTAAGPSVCCYVPPRTEQEAAAWSHASGSDSSASTSEWGSKYQGQILVPMSDATSKAILQAVLGCDMREAARGHMPALDATFVPSQQQAQQQQAQQQQQ